MRAFLRDQDVHTLLECVVILKEAHTTRVCAHSHKKHTYYTLKQRRRQEDTALTVARTHTHTVIHTVMSYIMHFVKNTQNIAPCQNTNPVSDCSSDMQIRGTRPKRTCTVTKQQELKHSFTYLIRLSQGIQLGHLHKRPCTHAYTYTQVADCNSIHANMCMTTTCIFVTHRCSYVRHSCSARIHTLCRALEDQKRKAA